MDTSNEDQPGRRIDAVLDIPGLILPTLERLNIVYVPDLIELDLNWLENQGGIGAKKVQLIADLQHSCKLQVSDDKPGGLSDQPKEEKPYSDIPLSFVPSLLKRTFDRLSIKSVADLLQTTNATIAVTGGWGSKKEKTYKALQSLYRLRFQAETEFAGDELLREQVDVDVIPDAELSSLTVNGLLETETSTFEYSNAIQSDISAFKRFIAQMTGAESNNAIDNESDSRLWRDMSLNVTKRISNFADRFKLKTVGQLRNVVQDRVVKCLETGDWIKVLELPNFGETTLKSLEDALREISEPSSKMSLGLRFTVADLPDPQMHWKSVPLRVNSRVESFLGEYQLNTLEQIFRFAVRQQVTNPTTGEVLSVLEVANLGTASLEQLKAEIEQLCSVGLESYRYGDDGRPKNLEMLLHTVESKLGQREFTVLKRRAQGMSLQDVGAELGVTRERIRQLEAKALKSCVAVSPEVIELTAPLFDYLMCHVRCSIRQAVAVLNAKQPWHVYLSLIIRDSGISVLDGSGELSIMPKTLLDAFPSILREYSVIEQQKAGDYHLEDVLESLRNQNVGYIDDVKAWLASNGGKFQLTVDRIMGIDGGESIRNAVKHQLVGAGYNGLFFDEIQCYQVVDCVEELHTILSGDADLLSDGRLRRSSQIYQRADDVISFVQNSNRPIRSGEIVNEIPWCNNQPQAVEYLTSLYECVAVGHGEYRHIRSLGLTTADIKAICTWAAGQLKNQSDGINDIELHQLYRATGPDIAIENSYSLLSICAKHKHLTRESNSKQIKYTFSE